MNDFTLASVSFKTSIKQYHNIMSKGWCQVFLCFCFCFCFGWGGGGGGVDVQFYPHGQSCCNDHNYGVGVYSYIMTGHSADKQKEVTAQIIGGAMPPPPPPPPPPLGATPVKHGYTQSLDVISVSFREESVMVYNKIST